MWCLRWLPIISLSDSWIHYTLGIVSWTVPLIGVWHYINHLPSLVPQFLICNMISFLLCIMVKIKGLSATLAIQTQPFYMITDICRKCHKVTKHCKNVTSCFWEETPAFSYNLSCSQLPQGVSQFYPITCTPDTTVFTQICAAYHLIQPLSQLGRQWKSRSAQMKNHFGHLPSWQLQLRMAVPPLMLLLL